MDACVLSTIDTACLLCGLALAAWWDLRTMRIPRIIPLMLIIVWGIHQVVVGIYTGPGQRGRWIAACLESLAAAVLMAGLLALVRWVMARPPHSSSLGVGDIKLMTIVALYLGWERSLAVLLLACGFALAMAVILPRLGWRQAYSPGAPEPSKHPDTLLSVIPFAPAILLGVVAIVPL